MSNYVRNFAVKNYKNRTTIPQLIGNNMSGCFFLKHGVCRRSITTPVRDICNQTVLLFYLNFRLCCQLYLMQHTRRWFVRYLREQLLARRHSSQLLSSV